jgi:outer membrane protein OmpA-like peptidoglycan-associated protein
MKFSKSYLALVVTFSAVINLFGQKSLVKAVYNNNYSKIIQMNGGNFEATKKDYNNQRALAFSYYQTDQVSKANESYQILFSKYAGQVDDNDRLFYALNARKNKNYRFSDSVLLELKNTTYKDKPFFPELSSELFELLHSEEEYWSENNFDSFFVVKPFAANSTDGEFALIPDQKGNVYYSAQKQSGLKLSISAWTGKPNYAMYFAKYGDSSYTMPVRSTVNDPKLNQYVSYVDINTGWIYITRNAKKLNSKKERVLEVYAIRQNPITKEWKEVPFQYNNSQFSVANLVISPDRKRVVFVSDNPAGYGKSDLWEAPIIQDDELGLKVGEMVNLGPELNTALRDNFPAFSDSGILYFSSEGHFGYGGLDLFYYDSAVGVINMGLPVNSNYDDFSAQIHDIQRWGTITSNRTGNDDNYFFRWSELLEGAQSSGDGIEAELVDSKTGLPIANEMVAFDNINDAEPAINVKSDDQGIAKFAYEIPDGENCVFQLSSHPCGYRYAIVKDTLATGDDRKIKIAAIPYAVGDELGSLFDIKPIYFEKGKSEMTIASKMELDRLVAILQDNPGLYVELGSHTDSRGSAENNFTLSQSRAKSSYDYLISRGVNSSRMGFRGYGESRLKNACADGVNCTEQQHSENRRTEYVVKRIVPCDQAEVLADNAVNNTDKPSTDNTTASAGAVGSGSSKNNSGTTSSTGKNSASTSTASNTNTTGGGGKTNPSTTAGNKGYASNSAANQGPMICGDADGDNIPDYLDSDSDNDGLNDAIEGKGDPDNDGLANFIDRDSDNDGIPDAVEKATDTDRDGKPNYIDLDSDGDGIEDSYEGVIDSDGDGVLNFLDSDSDNDGISDRYDGVEDFDSDGTPNYLDLDSDNDGISDKLEGRMDIDKDGKPNFLDSDSDGDTIPDSVERGNGQTPVDTDKDGRPDYIDYDSDGDGIADKLEAPACLPTSAPTEVRSTPVVTNNAPTKSNTVSNNSTNTVADYNGKLEYRVQFIIAKQRMNTKEFTDKGVGSVFEYSQGGYYKYTSDKVFKSEEEAANEKARLRSLGYQDAFVVLFQNGIRVK